MANNQWIRGLPKEYFAIPRSVITRDGSIRDDAPVFFVCHLRCLIASKHPIPATPVAGSANGGLMPPRLVSACPLRFASGIPLRVRCPRKPSGLFSGGEPCDRHLESDGQIPKRTHSTNRTQGSAPTIHQTDRRTNGLSTGICVPRQSQSCLHSGYRQRKHPPSP